jgi:glycosyltransferase involved in cell wall biosynthesis
MYAYRVLLRLSGPCIKGSALRMLPCGPRSDSSNVLIQKLHIHSPLILGQGTLHWAQRYSRPVIATNHFMPSNISQLLASNKLFNQGIYTYFTSFYNRFTHVTAPTNTALELLQAYHLSVPASVISNGINLRKFTPGPADSHIRQRFQLPEDRPLVLHVNRLNEEKRIEVLLNAIPQMQTDAHIVLVGSGPLEATLRAQVEGLQLQSRVSFLGFVKDRALLDLWRASDVFVIPSQAELQSLSTMEAMACGLPIVAADAGALPELVHHGRNGFLFQPGKSEELAGYLDTLASDGEMRKRIGAESIRYIAPHDHLAVLDQWEELYSRLSMDSERARKCKQQLLTANGFPAPS